MSFQSKSPAIRVFGRFLSKSPQPKHRLRGGYMSGGGFLLLILAGFLLWASGFQLDQTVRVRGTIIPEERTQTVQVANGGVLKTLLISEGDRVKQGQLLAELEADSSRAGVDEVRLQLALLEVQRLRATAEAEFRKPDFSDYTKTFPSVVKTQEALYQENVSSLDDELISAQKTLDLAQTEYDSAKALFDRGDAGQIEVSRALGEVIKAKAGIAAARNKFAINARREVSEIEQRIAAEGFKLAERQDALDKTQLRAPLGGVIKLLRVNTVGGVLRPGDELLQISPNGGEVIEAKIPPASVGQIEVGMPVVIRFDAFDFTIYGALRGELTYLSSDTIVEQDANGKSDAYYKGLVLVHPGQDNPKLPVSALRPGMNALLDVQTGKRTVLQFILKPILRAFSGAMSQR